MNLNLWIVWIILSFLYIWNFFYLRKVQIGFFSSYFNDLIALPWVFAFITLIYRNLLKVKNFRVSKYQIVFTFLFFSISFEILFPYFQPQKYIADWNDVLMYLLGSLIWWHLKSRL
jgi:hypothetical protein